MGGFSGFFSTYRKAIRRRYWLQKSVVPSKSMEQDLLFIYLKKETICSEATGDFPMLNLSVFPEKAD